MAVFQCEHLPSGVRVDEIVVHAVRLNVARVVEHVRSEQSVLIRNLVINPTGNEIFVHNLLAGEGVVPLVPGDRVVGLRVERQELRSRRVHRYSAGRQVSCPRRGRGNRGRQSDPLGLTYPFVVPEDEGTVLQPQILVSMYSK